MFGNYVVIAVQKPYDLTHKDGHTKITKGEHGDQATTIFPDPNQLIFNRLKSDQSEGYGASVSIAVRD